jgi:hypothetical protein
VPLDVTLKASGGAGAGKSAAARTVRMVAPCLLPPFSKIAAVQVASVRFWPLRLDPLVCRSLCFE